jgi:hypothetical protein
MRSRGLGDGLERALFIGAVERRDVEVLSAEAGEIRFRKADDLRAPPGRLAQEPVDLPETVVERRGDARRRQADDYRFTSRASCAVMCGR